MTSNRIPPEKRAISVLLILGFVLVILCAAGFNPLVLLGRIDVQSKAFRSLIAPIIGVCGFAFLFLKPIRNAILEGLLILFGGIPSALERLADFIRRLFRDEMR